MLEKQIFDLTVLIFEIKVLPLHEHINNNIMARPIRNTPALYGKDAERFLAEISELPSKEERKRERQRIKHSVNEFMSLVALHQSKG